MSATLNAPPPPYRCRDCGAAALHANGVLIRGCTCKAPVIAEMNAVVSHNGKVGTR